MKKEIIALSLALSLTACGGGSDDSSPTPEPISHCSTNTVIEAKLYKILTSYEVKTNTCNQLIKTDITDDDFFNKHGVRIYRAYYDVNGYDRFDSMSYQVDRHITLVTVPASDDTPSQDIEYTVVYTDDFITKYNRYTTNTDIIYSTTDEYRLILDYSLPEFVLKDFEEVTKEMQSSNIKYK